MHQVIESAVDPTAIAFLVGGLKADAEALSSGGGPGHPERHHQPTDPATTVALLKLNAVVGVRHGDLNGQDHLTCVGITCASPLHRGQFLRPDAQSSTLGELDLNPGAIIALSRRSRRREGDHNGARAADPVTTSTAR